VTRKPGKPVPQYLFDLEVTVINSKGEKVEAEPKTQEQQEELCFKNHVYELVFQDVEQHKQAHVREVELFIKESEQEREAK